MEKENLIQQAEELEVLHSIFGDQWKFITISNSYSIHIAKDIELWITLNEDYPSNRPPKYELYAPNLSRAQKDLIDKSFAEIYEINQGYPIIYQWIDKLKDIAFDGGARSSNGKKKDKFRSKAKNCINQLGDKKGSNLEIFHGIPITDRKSTFQGHCCKVTDQAQVQKLLDTLCENKKIAQAKHNILAYRIETKKNGLVQEFDEDGEAHAGGRLMHLLQRLELRNVAVVVTRWYGGIHLGPDRFKHINNAARQVLTSADFTK